MAAKFGGRVAKEKLYEQGTVSSAVRERFVTEVARITWAYKLAESTINLPESDTVPEIEVFQIDAKGNDVSDQVLTAIDKAISKPVIFEIVRNRYEAAEVRVVAAHKQWGTRVPKLSQYYSTGWMDATSDRQPLPTAISLPALYTALLAPLIEIDIRPGELMSKVAETLKATRKLEREIAALQRKIRNEKQLNRKIELRRILTSKQTLLELQR